MPDGHPLTVPAGFTVSLFADQLQMARFMALAPNGDVFLSEPASRTAGKITVLRDADKDGVAEIARDVRVGPQPAVRPRVLEGLPLRWQQRLGDSLHVPARSDGRRRRAGEDRGAAGERCRARPGHGEAPATFRSTRRAATTTGRATSSSTPPARSCTSRSASATNATPENRPVRRARGDPRIQPRRHRASGVRDRSAESGRARVVSRIEHALDVRERARSPRRRSRAGLHHVGPATAGSTAGRTRTSASTSIRR